MLIFNVTHPNFRRDITGYGKSCNISVVVKNGIEKRQLQDIIKIWTNIKNDGPV